MKKLFYANLMMVIFTCTIAYAEKPEIGIFAGPTVTKIFSNYNFKQDADVRYMAEFMFKYPFTKTISLRTGISFEDKGAQFKNIFITDVSGYPIGEGSMHFHKYYLIIPVLAEFSFGKKVQPFFNTGFYIGMLLKAKDIGRYNRTSYSFSNTYTKPVDFGVVASIGLKIPIKEKFALGFEMRNQVGVLDIFKHTLPGTENKKNFNYSTAFNIGFTYKIQSKQETKE